MKLFHKLLSGLALALAFSNAANASTVEYNYSLTSGSDTLTANFFVDDTIDPSMSSNILATVSSFTYNGTQYVADGGSLSIDSQIGTGASGFTLGLHSGPIILAINHYTADYGYGPTTYNSVNHFSMLGYQIYQGTDTGTLTKVTAPSATAVPEPEAYAMMLAGLGLVGFAARRQQKAA